MGNHDVNPVFGLHNVTRLAVTVINRVLLLELMLPV